MAAPKAPVVGGAAKDVSLDESVFGAEIKAHLVHEAVRAELNARRSGTASTRTRGEVAMTGAKAFRQKGTGRARAGALSVPQRTGGGVAFGPKPRGYAVKVNRKARRRAMRAALTLHDLVDGLGDALFAGPGYADGLLAPGARGRHRRERAQASGDDQEPGLRQPPHGRIGSSRVKSTPGT